MSESTVQTATESTGTTTQSPVRSRSRSGGWFVGLMAFTALLTCGYLYYRLVFIGHIEQLPAEVAALNQSIDEQIRGASTVVESRVQAVLTPRIDRVESLYQSLDQRLMAMEAAVAGVVASDVARATPPEADDWKIAEVGYLLRIANHRMLMERNVADARMLLANADSLLGELDDFRWHGVRELIAAERIALDQVQDMTDVQGVYLALEALKTPLGDLLKARPKLASSGDDRKPTVESGVWDALLQRLADVFRIQRIDSMSVKPLLSTDERYYIEQQLRLALEQAQLGALRRQQGVYDASLGNVRLWLEQEFEPGTSGLVVLLKSIDELAKVKLEAPLPDISGSLRALQEAERSSP